MWYKADTLFLTPKAYLKIDFICPEASYSPEASVLTDIFTRLLMDYLNEYGEPFECHYVFKQLLSLFIYFVLFLFI